MEQTAALESDVREDTDREGFCRAHMKNMFDYGNTLGNGWILKTYYKKLLSEMNGEFRHFKPQKQSMGDKLRKIPPLNPIYALQALPLHHFRSTQGMMLIKLQN